MKWMDTAWSQEGAGVCEIGGPQASASVIGYFREINRPDITSDEVPWCAAFYFWCLQKAGVDVSAIAPEDRLLAYSATKLGTRIRAPRVGCGCVMKRLGGHHVGFVAKWTPTTITLLGGNQANSVCEREFKRTDDMIFMWPEPVTENQLAAHGSRIIKGAARVQKDAAKATALPNIPPPPEIAMPPPEVLLGKGSALQQSVEQAIQFSNFLSAKWPWVMAAVALYYGARLVYTSALIRHWRHEDAATGKTVLEAAP